MPYTGMWDSQIQPAAKVFKLVVVCNSEHIVHNTKCCTMLHAMSIKQDLGYSPACVSTGAGLFIGCIIVTLLNPCWSHEELDFCTSYGLNTTH